MSKPIKARKTRVIQSKKDSSHAERSAYWEDYDKHRGFGPEGHGDDADREDTCANPDSLAEMETASPSTPQLLMGEAIAHLQGRQREVYILLMREDRTQEEAAKILNIGRTAVQCYKRRAIKFITGYCQQAIAKGRV